MTRSGRSARPTLTAPLVLAIVAIAGACGGSGENGDGDADEAIEIDLTTPKTVSEIDPDSKTPTLATLDGPADFTVRLPQRTISGMFRDVNVYADPNVSDDVPIDDPRRAISSLDLRYEFTDDTAEVIARLERLLVDFDVIGSDRDALAAFIDEFRTTTGASNGEIVYDDFVGAGESGISQLRLEQTEHDTVGLQFRLMQDAVVAMTLFVTFDNGVTSG